MDLVKSVFEAVLGGGSDAIIAILLLFLFASLWVMRFMYKTLRHKDTIIEQKVERNETLISNYYEANKTVSEALNSIHIALIEIKSKL